MFSQAFLYSPLFSHLPHAGSVVYKEKGSLTQNMQTKSQGRNHDVFLIFLIYSWSKLVAQTDQGSGTHPEARTAL